MSERITLATLASATPQQVFDQVYAHMHMQKIQCTVHDAFMGAPRCAYRSGDGGMSCAAGCLMTDEEYEALPSTLKTAGWEGLIKSGAVTSEHAALITELQFVHDTHVPERWHSKLEEVAQRHQLKIPAIQN